MTPCYLRNTYVDNRGVFIPFMTSLCTTGIYLFIKNTQKGHFIIRGKKSRGSRTPRALCVHVPDSGRSVAAGLKFSFRGNETQSGVPRRVVRANQFAQLQINSFAYFLSDSHFFLSLVSLNVHDESCSSL